MLDSIIKSLFVTVPAMLSMAFYNKIDRVYAITDKISSKIKVEKKWQPFLAVCCSFTFMIIMGSVRNIPRNLFSICSSFIFGIVLGFAIKIQNENK